MWSGGTNGPRVLPGAYTARLTVDSLPPVTRMFRVRQDPRATNVTLTDLQAQHTLATQVFDKLNAANEAILMIRGVKAEIDDRSAKAKDAQFTVAADALKKKLSDVEQEIYQVQNQSSQDPLNFPIKLNDKLAGLLGAVEGVEGRPTAQTYVVYRQLSALLQTQLDRLAKILDVDVPAFNTQWVKPKGLDPITKKPLPAE
jgi:hypothetical protein